jgi:predicted nuclease of predicted toxin-antitoxin system
MQPEWEIWLDAHLSPAIAKWMSDFTGFPVKSSYILSLYALDDLAIYQKAKEQGNVIFMSKDSDFQDIISRLGSPPKLINLKIGNCDNRILWGFLKPNIKQAIEILVSSEINIIELE